MNKAIYPQAGVITSLNRQQAAAKVFLPLFKMETDWIPVATNLLYETTVTVTNGTMASPEFSSDPPKLITRPPGDAAITHIKIEAKTGQYESGTMAQVAYGTLSVGDEVVVVFLNGDINQGRVIARI